jgi:hypothetical protein
VLKNPESVYSLVRLIDACTQCRQMFHATSVTHTDATLRQLMEKIEQRLEEFGIELRNEVRQMGRRTVMSVIEDFRSFPFERLSAESATDALWQVLDWYDQALKAELSSEARSTIARQHDDLQQSYAVLAKKRNQEPQEAQEAQEH